MVANSFMETVQKLHGAPNIIVSYKDPIFTGNFWTELFSCLSTELAHMSSYHPQYNGQTNITNKCLEGYLRCFGADKQTNGSRGYPWKNGGIKLPSIHHKNDPFYGTLWLSSKIQHIFTKSLL